MGCCGRNVEVHAINTEKVLHITEACNIHCYRFYLRHNFVGLNLNQQLRISKFGGSLEVEVERS